MKIVYLIPNLRNCGPINVAIGIATNICAGKIYFISIDGKRDSNILIERLKQKSISHIQLHMSNKDIFAGDTRALSAILKKIHPDVVHSHGIQANILLSKIPHGDFLRISTIHSNYLEDYKEQFGILLSPVLAKIHFLAHNKLDLNICCSQSVLSATEKYVKKCVCIRNGTKTYQINKCDKIKAKIEITKQLHLPTDAKLFIYVGALAKCKSVPRLIKMFVAQRLNDEYLLIVGDGKERRKCKKNLDDHVLMLGKQQNPWRFLLASDIYISNSKSEGLSMSVLEAMAARNYLLLSDIPSHRECINLNKNSGLTFTQSDFSKKKKHIVQSLRKLPNNPSAVITEKTMAQKYLNIYMGEI